MPYILVALSTLILSVAIVGGIAYMKPDVFGAASVKKVAAKGVQQQPQKIDSAEIAAKYSVANKTSIADSIEISSRWEDTVKLLCSQLSSKSQEVATLEQRLKQNYSAEDSTKVRRRIQFAKLVESMSAESAAKVLNNMEDGEVKSILLNVKARQAAKILAALEPRRAARLMN